MEGHGLAGDGMGKGKLRRVQALALQLGDDLARPVDRIPRALNIHLPNEVAAYEALWVPADFHARYSVTSKEYIYRVLNTQNRDPFAAGRAWHYPRPIDDAGFAAMERAAANGLLFFLLIAISPHLWVDQSFRGNNTDKNRLLDGPLLC